MGFSTTNRNMRSSLPRQPLIKRPITQQISRPIPQPQMSRPMQPIRPPTGLPNINQPPLGLPNEMQQPTGMPPTQMQMPTPSVAQPVEQSQSMFAPPVQQTQPAINPVFQPPQQIQQPVERPGDMYGGLTPGQALGGEFTMQQPDKNQYVDFQGNPVNPMSQIPMMTKEEYDAQQVAGPIAPNIIKY